jgi:proteasome lid subunit RPN8/RPN11
MRSRLAGPFLLTGLILAAGLASAPGLSDPVAGATPAALYLKIPWVYLVFAPLFTLWDGVSMLSMTRLVGFLGGIVALYVLWRITRWLLSRWSSTGALRGRLLHELKILVVSATLFVAFVSTGATWHRPMLSLAGTRADEVVVDFHSHTNVSHDVSDTWMHDFDAETNRRWHSRAGFDVAFITDHNVSYQTSDVRRQTLDARRQTPDSTVLCPGIEISAWRAHIVLLGDTGPVDRRQYKGTQGLLALLATSDSAYGALSLASLPEYRRNHWNRLDSLASAGLDGFEIVNASPKANELTRPEVNRVIDVARSHNRFVAGVSDSHGWGATSMVWNLVHAPRQSRQDPCSAVLHQLRTGFGSVRIIERHRLRPDDWWPALATPIGVVWETWRSMGWPLAASWLIWVWGIAMIRRRGGQAR